MLSDRELARYNRQIMIPGWGNEGQEKLKKAKVAVAGAGGLGSAILLYLAAAGVGNIRVIDNDKVDVTNLNRQVLYTDADVGRRKARVAAERLEALNYDIRVEGIVDVIGEDNVSELVGDCPIVDAMDNLPTRFLLNRVAVRRKLPLFHGAVYAWEGRATTVIPGETPCLRCLYQDVVPGKPPVAGVAPAVIGCIQAGEVVKYLLGQGDLLAGRLLIFDGLAMKFNEMKVRRDPDCPECGVRSSPGLHRT
ncbi:MAG: HesA/MoeB/ThiF family protein [Dehalococcoidia bacterium]|nr:HesA/MoeB/ThiF family protein [Dehalococcoidia bacterium]